MTTVVLATILSMAGAFVLATPQRDPHAAKSPFVGSWSADLSQSRLDPKMPFKGVALITYEVSTDGQTLTARTSGLIEQVVMFKRREL